MLGCWLPGLLLLTVRLLRLLPLLLLMLWRLRLYGACGGNICRRQGHCTLLALPSKLCCGVGARAPAEGPNKHMTEAASKRTSKLMAHRSPSMVQVATFTMPIPNIVGWSGNGGQVRGKSLFHSGLHFS